MATVFLCLCHVEGEAWREMWGMYRMNSQGHFLATRCNSARPRRRTAERAPPPRLAGTLFPGGLAPAASHWLQVPCEICPLVFFHFLNIFLSSFQSHTPSLNNICFRGLERQYGTICSVSWPLMGQPFHDRGRMRMCGLDSYIQWGSDTHWLLWSSHLYSPSILWALSSKPGLFCANMSVPFWHVRNCRWYSSNSCLREREAPFPALGPTWMPLGPGQDALGSVLLIGRFFSPRWTAGGSSLSPAGEVTTYKSLCAFYL